MEGKRIYMLAYTDNIAFVAEEGKRRKEMLEYGDIFGQEESGIKYGKDENTEMYEKMKEMDQNWR